MNSPRTFSERQLKIAALVIGLLFSIILGEMLARSLFAYQNGNSGNKFVEMLLGGRLSLDDYEMPAEEYPRHWRLRAGYEATVREVFASKIRAGKQVGAFYESDDENILKVNSDGFRGDELQVPKQRFRVLVLGDSVTFGSIRTSYPLMLGEILQESGHKVEILNGGVEGYSARNLELEIERYISADPDLVMIQIGWNDLFATNPFENDLERHSKLVWLINRAVAAGSVYLRGRQEAALSVYERAKKPVYGSPQLQELASFTPNFLAPVSRMVDRFKSANIPVAMMTLPGLFHEEVEFDPRALLLAHLPQYTDNPIVLMRLTTLYNNAIRQFAAKNNLQLIDLAVWSKQALVPRHLFYVDSVHLTDAGLGHLASFLAEETAHMLK